MLHVPDLVLSCLAGLPQQLDVLHRPAPRALAVVEHLLRPHPGPGPLWPRRPAGRRSVRSIATNPAPFLVRLCSRNPCLLAFAAGAAASRSRSSRRATRWSASRRRPTRSWSTRSAERRRKKFGYATLWRGQGTDLRSRIGRRESGRRRGKGRRKTMRTAQKKGFRIWAGSMNSAEGGGDCTDGEGGRRTGLWSERLVRLWCGQRNPLTKRPWHTFLKRQYELHLQERGAENSASRGAPAPEG